MKTLTPKITLKAQYGAIKWDGGITDCAADIGDEAYEALDAAITEAMEAD